MAERKVQVFRIDVTYPADMQPVCYCYDTARWCRLHRGSTVGGGEFHGWPANRLYLSRSAADRRAQLFRDLGAEADVRPSFPVEWGPL